MCINLERRFKIEMLSHARQYAFIDLAIHKRTINLEVKRKGRAACAAITCVGTGRWG